MLKAAWVDLPGVLCWSLPLSSLYNRHVVQNLETAEKCKEVIEPMFVGCSALTFNFVM